MPRSWRILLLAIPLLAALPLAAVPEPPAGNPPPAEARLEPQPARLRQEGRAFLALPREQRHRMIKLDEELQQIKNPRRRQHLLEVLRRYASWLERLPELERQQIVAAPTKQVRLARIRALREEQWLRRQPQAVRSALAALQEVRAGEQAFAPRLAGSGLSVAGVLLAPGAGGRPLVAGLLRQEERRRRHEWHIAVRHWEDLGKRPLPVWLSDFSEAVQRYVREYLQPLLAPQEHELLRRAEGELKFPYVLVYLADRHPPALPGAYGPKTFRELPTDVQQHIKKVVMVKVPKGGGGEPILKPKIRAAEGKWPRFAIEITRMAAHVKGGAGKKLSPRYEFWPSHFKELSLEVQEFVTGTLTPRLSGDEKTLLVRSEGRWPEYPQTIQDLANRHSLRVPWQTLPGRRKDWGFYRNWSRRNAAPI